MRYMKIENGTGEIKRRGKDKKKKAIVRSTVPFSMALQALHFSFVLWERLARGLRE